MQPALTKVWKPFPPIDPEQKDALKGYPPVLQQLLVNRGMTTRELAEEFISAACPADCDPFNIKDMDIAVRRLLKAGTEREKSRSMGITTSTASPRRCFWCRC